MTPAEEYQRLKEIFFAAMELPASEREAYLLESCAGDESLLDKALQLLDAGEAEEVTSVTEDVVPVSLIAAALTPPSAGTATEGPAEAGQRGGWPTLPDRYRVDGVLGAGGMGKVYRAYDHQLTREVAIKVVAHATSSQAKRFLDEARVMAQLDHPRILTVFEFGTSDDGEPFYTMPVIRDGTLQEVITRLRDDRSEVSKYPLMWRMRVLIEVCDAVQYAHGRGVLHRDLKPSNILRGRHGDVLVMDWGLSKIFREGSIETARGADGTMPGIILGTPHYMAPEQIDGEAQTTSDVYALGVILYELLTLRRPFEGGPLEVLAAKRSEMPEPPTHWEPTLPESLATVAMQSLAMLPAERTPSVVALREQVQRWIDDEDDRSNRRTMATRRAAEGVEAVERYRQLSCELDELEDEVATIPVPGDGPVSRSDAADRARAARAGLRQAEARCVALLESALALDGDNATARDTLLEFYRSQALAAESRGDDAQVSHLRERIEALELPSTESEVSARDDDRPEERAVDDVMVQAPLALDRRPLTQPVVAAVRRVGGAIAERPRVSFVAVAAILALLSFGVAWLVGRGGDTGGRTVSAGVTGGGPVTVEPRQPPTSRVEIDTGEVTSVVWREARGEDDPSVLGVGSCVRFDLEARREHLIVVERDRRWAWLETVRLEPGESLQLALPEASVVVRSNVTDDNLWVDGWSFGPTGSSPIRLDPGWHRLRVEKDGYEPWQQDVTLSASELRELRATLRPSPPPPSSTPELISAADPAQPPADGWSTAIDAIAKSSRYRGLVLVPQRGLEPLGEDPETRLWEFRHVASGRAPERSHGKLTPTPEMGVVLVLLPPGRFTMGSAGEGPDEQPPREVSVPAFFMSKYELTAAQWARVSRVGEPVGEAALRPASNSSWTEVATGLGRVDLRLPTEAEWEYAARAGSTSPYSFGRVERLSAYAWSRSNSSSTSHAIGRKVSNGFGLFDVHGNVWEWCEDTFERGYLGAPTDGSARVRAGIRERVCRGGSYSFGDDGCRSAFRNYRGEGTREPDIGVRPARSVD